MQLHLVRFLQATPAPVAAHLEGGTALVLDVVAAIIAQSAFGAPQTQTPRHVRGIRDAGSDAPFWRVDRCCRRFLAIDCRHLHHGQAQQQCFFQRHASVCRLCRCVEAHPANGQHGYPNTDSLHFHSHIHLDTFCAILFSPLNTSTALFICLFICQRNFLSHNLGRNCATGHTSIPFSILGLSSIDNSINLAPGCSSPKAFSPFVSL